MLNLYLIQPFLWYKAMICSLKTYVLDVARGFREGKPTSSEGTCVGGWVTMNALIHIQPAQAWVQLYPSGKGYSSSQLLWEGMWTTKERWRWLGLSIPRHLFFADSSFRVVLKEKQFVHSICFPTRKAISYPMIDWLMLIGWFMDFFIDCITIV